jgi:hypothetical protein
VFCILCEGPHSTLSWAVRIDVTERIVWLISILCVRVRVRVRARARACACMCVCVCLCDFHILLRNFRHCASKWHRMACVSLSQAHQTLSYRYIITTTTVDSIRIVGNDQYATFCCTIDHTISIYIYIYISIYTNALSTTV